jgi:hypothetical protein
LLFVAMGCVLDELHDDLRDPRSDPIRYLYSPVTNDFVSLLGYEYDERIPPSEVANWERRLGVEIPKDPRWFGR